MTAPARLCVVGIGATGAAGLSATALGAAAWAGLTAFRITDKEELSLGQDVRLSSSPLFDLHTPGIARISEMLELVLREALPTNLPAQLPLRLALSLPSWASREQATRALGNSFATTDPRLGLRAPLCSLGNTASGLRALLQLFEALLGDAHAPPQLALWAGADTLIEPQLLAALEAAGLMSCAAHSEGVIAGEGAAALALCTEATARALGLNVMAQLERPHVRAFDGPPSRGKALSSTLMQALDPAAPAPLAALLSDGAFLAWRSEVLACALADNARATRKAELVYPGQLLGEVGAAFAPLAVSLAVFAANHGLIDTGTSAVVCADGQWTGALRLSAAWQPSVLMADRLSVASAAQT